MKRLLQVCFIAAMVFGLASCEKEGLSGTGSGASGNGGSGTSTTSLVGTSWQWTNGTITFTDATNVTIATNQYGTYYGSYTYSNGSGVINVNINGTPFTIPFTVSGSTMSAQNTPDGNITLTQVGGSNPNPNPGGGGTSTTSLVGTSWQWTNGTITFTDATNVTIATNQYGTYYGSYTYSNGSGVIDVNIQGTPFTIPFTVSGSTMLAQNTPDGNITLTQVGGGNPNPNPNPNPGGGLTSLTGTAWQYSGSWGSVTLYFTTINTGYSLEYDYDDGGTYRDNFTYTYSNGSGVIYFEDEKEDGSFTVSGNTLYVYGIAFTRIQ